MIVTTLLYNGSAQKLTVSVNELCADANGIQGTNDQVKLP